MFLALDVGNTNIHFGVFRGEALVEHWDVSNSRDRTADDLRILFAQLLAAGGIAPAAVAGAAIACVVPAVTATVAEAVRRLLGVEPFVLRAEGEHGLAIRYDDPREIGADRIANAVGGIARYGAPLVVVDFGTATTFDAIAPDGAYLGGAIAPGLRISVEALTDRAARLPRIELVRPASAIGTTTASGMQSGIIFGYAGLVEALVGRIAREIGGEPRVVATGGLAELIARETGVVGTVDQHLTLEGLRIVAGRAGKR